MCINSISKWLKTRTSYTQSLSESQSIQIYILKVTCIWLPQFIKENMNMFGRGGAYKRISHRAICVVYTHLQNLRNMIRSCWALFVFNSVSFLEVEPCWQSRCLENSNTKVNCRNRAKSKRKKLMKICQFILKFRFYFSQMAQWFFPSRDPVSHSPALEWDKNAHAK